MIYQKTGLYRNSGYQETEYRPKKNTNYLLIFDLIIFFGTVSAIIYVVFFTSVFTINRIKIYGLEQIDKKSFTQEVKTKSIRKNLLLLDTIKLRKTILGNYTQIKEVYINKDLPSVLVLNVKERHLVFVWKVYDQYYSVDEDGIVYEKLSEETNPILEIPGSNLQRPKFGKKYFSYNETSFIQKINKSFSNETKLDIQKIILNRSAFEIQIQTKKFRIIFNDIRSYQAQINSLKDSLPQIQNKIHEYIDVRVPGKIFYK